MGLTEDNIVHLVPEGRSRAHPVLPLVVKDLTFMVDGQVLVNRLNFRLDAGNRTIILGPNGAGKSLSLRLMHGLLQPSAGEISWRGPSANHPKPIRDTTDRSTSTGPKGRNAGQGAGQVAGLSAGQAAGQAAGRAIVWQAMVFQRPVILRRSALANVRYALKVHGIGREEADYRAHLALKRTGLDAKADQPARTLSGGEQQRLALARAWALNPEVLFLDEPTANLDPATTNQVEGIINRMHHDGTKIIMTTHDIAQAQRLADEVLFLYRGEVFEHTPAAEFFTHAHTDEARAFLSGRLLG